MKQIIGTCKVFLKLSLRIRFKRAKENLAKWGRVLGTVARTVVRHADYAKNAMKIKAAQTIQAYFRARVADKEMKPKIEEKKFAATTVFRMWRTFEERTKLLKWLTENCAAAESANKDAAANEAEAAAAAAREAAMASQ